ncbi:uncharacterized protein BX663DRAFT_559688 [Cokeromyces recurvatus]|uniref:uncharacterized protein n=1 Tax=Cokeromyces recurvatus TaxID=90255 RepID=UPI00221EF288|nr:uncharacterized protein BX663DRAFT_559688 [Cokeromyces recurvatus]KAI7904708.1 hypothetical protein BX663DRAFT_559688 [Cokeromyces recurvatus]
MGVKNDYRISTIAVLCKDCNQDVGLYPARHKCNDTTKRLQLPTLCSSTLKSSNSHWSQQQHEEEDDDNLPDLIASTPGSITRQPSDSSMESGKWNAFMNYRSNNSDVKSMDFKQNHDKEEESIYFDNYATHLLKSSNSLNESNNTATTNNGKQLWGRVKENEKWKELITEKKNINKPNNKLWGKIIRATVLKEEDADDNPESDNDDWEGETHVSRILREYYENKRKINNVPFPSWLIDDRTPISTLALIPAKEQLGQEEVVLHKRQQSVRRLWQSSEEETLTSRQKEIQALRQIAQGCNSYYKNSTVSRSQSERVHHTHISTSQSSAYHHSLYNQDNKVLNNTSTTPRRTYTTSRPYNSSNLSSFKLKHIK